MFGICEELGDWDRLADWAERPRLRDDFLFHNSHLEHPLTNPGPWSETALIPAGGEAAALLLNSPA